MWHAMTLDHIELLFGIFFVLLRGSAATTREDWREETKQNAYNFSQKVDEFVETVLGVKNLQVHRICPTL